MICCLEVGKGPEIFVSRLDVSGTSRVVSAEGVMVFVDMGEISKRWLGPVLPVNPHPCLGRNT